MRFAFLLSGAGGFLLVSLVGIASGRGLEPVLRDAALACLFCGFVGRWFWRRLERAFAETLALRRAAAEAAAAAATAAADSAPAPARPAAAAGKTAAPAAAPSFSAPRPAASAVPAPR